MMMNQGGSNTQTIAAIDPNSLENRYIVSGNQGQASSSSYYPSTQTEVASAWQQTHRVENSSTDNGVHSQPTYQYDQTAPLPQQPQPASSASNLNGTVNAPQDYSGYASYQNPADPYGYGNAGYQGYYNKYPPPQQQQQQPNNQSYSQPVGGGGGGGAYQNTGAPYQPISTFQNSGSYAGSASYSSTYYNPADYQTAGGYSSSSYANQATTAWNGGNYPNYTSQQQYAPYNPEAPGVYTPATATSTTPQTYQQQWADYYNQTEVSCAPGTENLSVTSTQNVGCSVPGVTTGYQTSVSLPPPPPLPAYAPSWRPESSSSELPSVQSGAAVSGAHDAYWNHVAPASQSQIHYIPPIQPQVQKPFDQNSSYDSFQDQQKTASSQPSNIQYPASQQVPYEYPASQQVPYVSHTYQTPPQAAPSVDTRRVNKVQIPANPRFTSNVTLSLPKADKDISSASPAAKPAYIGVSLPKPVDKASSSSSDSLLKSGMFPKSLRGYVERALARCKDDAQMAASQVLMKEIITKATADSTLYTRDWDTEPLFPLPKEDATIKESSSSNLVPSLLNKRSPTRRSKSRWEPLSEEKSEKSVERPASWNDGSQNNGAWGHVNNKERKPFVWNAGSKNGNMSNAKFHSLEQKSASRFNQKPFKKQRLSDGVDATENGHASSDSDMEQGLAAYYAGAIALADSPEERKRREHRSKRFEKVQGHRGQNNHFKPKNAGAQNIYTRRANALAISNKFEDGTDRAVEDIDWDSLTVKGTCQEIEKRYLRLTSAPDPATVRPEDVLEKALLMVKNSQKNYLFKCDQLKSIRQDLTVQRIRNQLTVKVYETHARIALEVGDLPEYNQCQSQLKSLYAEGIEGCHMEFSAYNLLCAILHSNNNRDLLSSMASLSVETRRHEAVKHALAVRATVTSGNYVTFFRLYKTAPNLSTCLMDLYVEKMRFKAVTCMCRSYRPTIPVSHIAQILGFTSASEESEEKDSEGLEECIEWLKLHGACPVADSNGEMQLDAKSTSSSLYMPETDAVSHGDANLAVNDFFTRTPS